MPNNTFREEVKREILELFCGVPIDCDAETEIKLNDIINNAYHDSHKRLIEKLVGEIEKEMNKPSPNELFFDDCPECGAKVNRDFIRDKFIDTRNAGLGKAISIINQTLK